MKETVIFDLAGTLTDSAPGIINAIEYVRIQEGLPQLTASQLRSCIGPPLSDSFSRLWGVDQKTAQYFIKRYREYYKKEGIFENSLYPGVREMLAALKAQNIECRICSAKPEPMVFTVIEHFGIRNNFTEIIGAKSEAAFPGKGKLLADMLAKHPARAIMVGDRKDDVQGAGYNKIPCIGTLWGYGGKEELLQAGAEFFADYPAEIPQIAAAVFR